MKIFDLMLLLPLTDELFRVTAGSICKVLEGLSEVNVFGAGLLLMILVYVSRLTDLSEIRWLPLCRGRLLNPAQVLCLDDHSHEQLSIVDDLLIELVDRPKHPFVGQKTDYEDTT